MLLLQPSLASCGSHGEAFHAHRSFVRPVTPQKRANLPAENATARPQAATESGANSRLRVACASTTTATFIDAPTEKKGTYTKTQEAATRR